MPIMTQVLFGDSPCGLFGFGQLIEALFLFLFGDVKEKLQNQGAPMDQKFLKGVDLLIGLCQLKLG